MEDYCWNSNSHYGKIISSILKISWTDKIKEKLVDKLFTIEK